MMISAIDSLATGIQVQGPHPALRGGPLPENGVSNAAVQGSPQLNPADSKLREVFDDFVGQTFYGQLLSAMRSTLDKPAYFHGGRAEEAFQAQLDQVMAEKMADATADQFTGPMFDLFSMSRR
jgi:peptidoglycan hydrolase FlgJ